MKKLAIIIGVLIAGSPFVSCKKMKDDIKDLKNELSDLQKQNDTLKDKNAELTNEADVVANLIGSNEPIIATTTFVDNNGSNRTVSSSYKFKSSDYSTQRLLDNKDGSYYIYIVRFSDVNRNDEYARITFTYNATTKAVTNTHTRHYWHDFDSYYDLVRYYDGYTGATQAVTVESLDVTTGAISVKVASAGTAAYTTANSSWAPNSGKAVSTNFSFAGKLKLFKQD